MKWLALNERLELARRAVLGAMGQPVLATCNLEPDRSRHYDELTQMLDTGVSAVVLVPPDGLGDDPSALEDYYGGLIDASPVPIFLYEWPQVQPYLLDATVFGDLVHQHGLSGIKDTTCTLPGIIAKIQRAPGSVIFQANTPYLVEAIEAGASGIMAVTSSACADLVIALWNSIVARKGDEVHKLHRELVFLDAVLRFGYPATAQYLAKLRGLPFEVHRRWPVAFPVEALQALEVWYRGFEGSQA